MNCLSGHVRNLAARSFQGVREQERPLSCQNSRLIETRLRGIPSIPAMLTGMSLPDIFRPRSAGRAQADLSPEVQIGLHWLNFSATALTRASLDENSLFWTIFTI